MNTNNKKAAAISAVMSYIRQQEEAFAFQPLNATRDGSIPTAPRAMSNAWGMSGRQAQMQIRNLMHMKALNRLT